MTTRYNISISQDGIWAGQGHYDHRDNGISVSGCICDCDAILGGTQEKAAAAYSAIENAITDLGHPENGDVEADGKIYAWTLEALHPLVGKRVEAGEGDDYDTGRVDSVSGGTATVSWDSLVVTACDVGRLKEI